MGAAFSTSAVGVVRARAGTVSAPARHRDSIMIRFFKGKASFVWLWD